MNTQEKNRIVLEYVSIQMQALSKNKKMEDSEVERLKEIRDLLGMSHEEIISYSESVIK